MKKSHYLAAEDDSEATLVEPRFNEEAKEAARPVVPLSRVRSADLYGVVASGGPRVPARYGRNGWPRSIVIMLAVVAIAAVVTAAAIYRSTSRTPAPTAAPQTVNETTIAPETETAVRAPAPPAATSAREIGTRETGTAAPVQPARAAEVRVEVSPREEPENRVSKDDERRARDEDKSAERALKDEKKQARREAKEAERTAEKQRDQGKREETRPRLVGIYVEGRKH